MNRGTAEQFKALHRGLDEIVPSKLLKKYFNEKELELVVTGLGTVLQTFLRIILNKVKLMSKTGDKIHAIETLHPMLNCPFGFGK